MGQILFVGEQPGTPGGEAFVPYGRGTGVRLARLAGMDPHAFRHTFEFINLMSWGTWSVPSARMAAFQIMPTAKRVGARRIVLLGKRVAEAWGYGDHNKAPYFREFGDDGLRVVVIPHPSGRNRMWNDTRNVKRAEKLLRRWVRWARLSS